MKYVQPLHQRGYTLIELLLYVAIVGALLTSVTYFFGTVTDARVKNQTILEVNEQGAAVMDYITQTIRNATSVTAPAIGVSGASLTLVVPTGALSPTVFSMPGSTTLGYNGASTATDSSDSGSINGTKFVASASGTISTLNAYVASPISASPNDKGQMAIYSGTASPGALLASSASTALTGDAWNTFSISPVSVTSGQTYWLVYNANGVSTTNNNLKSHPGTANQSMYKAQTFNTWPASWTGTNQSSEFLLYGTIVAGGSPTVQVQEGAGAPVSLTDNDVVISGLSFKNLSRASTPGIVQASFTLSRLNPNNKNEYDYQKTFTATAEVTW
jgi:Tfp pilus assembly protein PilW